MTNFCSSLLKHFFLFFFLVISFLPFLCFCLLLFRSILCFFFFLQLLNCLLERLRVYILSRFNPWFLKWLHNISRAVHSRIEYPHSYIPRDSTYSKEEREREKSGVHPPANFWIDAKFVGRPTIWPCNVSTPTTAPNRNKKDRSPHCRINESQKDTTATIICLFF